MKSCQAVVFRQEVVCAGRLVGCPEICTALTLPCRRGAHTSSTCDVTCRLFLSWVGDGCAASWKLNRFHHVLVYGASLLYCTCLRHGSRWCDPTLNQRIMSRVVFFFFFVLVQIAPWFQGEPCGAKGCDMPMEIAAHAGASSACSQISIPYLYSAAPIAPYMGTVSLLKVIDTLVPKACMYCRGGCRIQGLKLLHERAAQDLLARYPTHARNNT
ncbi:hypothetical protein V8C34DRAFT_78707 [Trichoderma compactum]